MSVEAGRARRARRAGLSPAAAPAVLRPPLDNRPPPHCTAPLRCRSIHEIIGRGRQSKVYKARLKQSLEYVAVKACAKDLKPRVLQEASRQAAPTRGERALCLRPGGAAACCTAVAAASCDCLVATPAQQLP